MRANKRTYYDLIYILVYEKKQPPAPKQTSFSSVYFLSLYEECDLKRMNWDISEDNGWENLYFVRVRFFGYTSNIQTGINSAL